MDSARASCVKPGSGRFRLRKRVRNVHLHARHYHLCYALSTQRRVSVMEAVILPMPFLNITSLSHFMPFNHSTFHSFTWSTITVICIHYFPFPFFIHLSHFSKEKWYHLHGFSTIVFCNIHKSHLHTFIFFGTVSSYRGRDTKVKHHKGTLWRVS